MRRYTAEGALVLAAFFFGVTFPLVHDALEDVTPFGYLTFRFAIAVLALAPFAIHVVRAEGTDRRLLLRAGGIAGVLLFGGYAFQTVGLQYTSPSTSAFITGLYVVITPVIESVVRRHLPALVGVCRDRRRDGRAVPADGRGAHSRQGRAADVGLRAHVRGLDRVPGRVREPHPPAAIRERADGDGRGAVRPGVGGPGHRPPHAGRRGSPWRSPAWRARRWRCRCSSWARSASRRAAPR